MVQSRLLTTRRGFTLVELMLVVVIIAILIGLLVPTIGMVRESSRAMACKGNLRQVSQACHNYNSAHGYLPYSGSSRSVFYQLLPYIEKLPLYERGLIPDGTTSNSAAMQAVAGVVVPLYVCPTRGSPIVVNVKPVCRRARSDYAAISGGQGPLSGVGMLPGRPMSTIADGISNVMMISERYLEPGKYSEQVFRMSTVAAPPPFDFYNGYNGTGWIDDLECRIETAGNDIYSPVRMGYLQAEANGIPAGYGRVFLNPQVPPPFWNPPPYSAVARVPPEEAWGRSWTWPWPHGDGFHTRLLGGPHGSLNVVMCDGSVRGVNYLTNQVLFTDFQQVSDGSGYADQLNLD